ncbi:hypothetical protein [Flavobacterium faecale]
MKEKFTSGMYPESLISENPVPPKSKIYACKTGNNSHLQLPLLIQ